jgi:uncharacterized protein YycO
MNPLRAGYEVFANSVCRALVGIVDVRMRKRARRLTDEEKRAVERAVQPGDILVDSNDSFPGWQLLSKIFLGSNWVHMGIYIGDGKVIDAGRETHVAEISLNRFLRTSRVAVLRPHYREQADVDAALARARDFLGRPYNRALNPASTTDVYCTQMLREVLQSMPHPIHVNSMNVLGRHIVSPDAFVYNDSITMVLRTPLSDVVIAELVDQAA